MSRKIFNAGRLQVRYDKADSQHFGQLTRSICQLANLEHGIREQNQLEQMSDDDLKRLADIAYKKLEGKSK